MVQLLNRCREHSRPLSCHLLPQPFDGIELGAIGRQEQTHDIWWQHQRFCFVTAPIIHKHNIESLLIGVCKLIQKDLNVGGVQVRSLQKKAVTRRRFDGPIHLKVLQVVLHRSQRCHPSEGEPLALHGS
jgi:hypothetical protein